MGKHKKPLSKKKKSQNAINNQSQSPQKNQAKSPNKKKQKIKKVKHQNKEKKFLQKKRKEKQIASEKENLELNDEEEIEIPEDLEKYYSEFMITPEEIENLPHDKFKIYKIPKTKDEHKKNLDDLIKKSDIILEFIDVRNVKGTRCEKIEKEIKDKNKTLILVLAKADTVSKEFLDSTFENLRKQSNLVLILSSYIREKISGMYDKLKKIINGNPKKNKNNKIGIIGYPNMGKKLFIQSIQLLMNANSDDKIIYFNENKSFGIDSIPGTIFEKDDENTLFISKEYKDISKIPKPEKLIEKLLDFVDKEKIKKIYNFKDFNNLNELYKEFSIKFKYDNKDHKSIAQHIIQDIIDGKIMYEISK